MLLCFRTSSAVLWGPSGGDNGRDRETHRRLSLGFGQTEKCSAPRLCGAEEKGVWQTPWRALG